MHGSTILPMFTKLRCFSYSFNELTFEISSQFAATAENRPIAKFPMSSSSSSSYLRNAAGCHIAVTLSDFQAPKADEDVEIYVSLFHRGSNIASSFLSERGGLNFPNQ